MNSPKIDLSDYDFVDFGCSTGGSIKFAQSAFKGGTAVGIDIDPAKVEKTRAMGHDAVLADATDPQQFSGHVRFSILSHFLEHLPSYETVVKSLETAIRISDEFVFIRQPWFDCDGELFRNGLKLYWSDWHGHPMTLTTLQMHRAVSRAIATGAIARATIFGYKPIVDTDDECIIPLSAPRNSSKYDPEAHGPKVDPPIALTAYRELVMILAKKDPSITAELLPKFPGIVMIHDQAHGGTLAHDQPAEVEDAAASHALASVPNNGAEADSDGRDG